VPVTITVTAADVMGGAAGLSAAAEAIAWQRRTSARTLLLFKGGPRRKCASAQPQLSAKQLRNGGLRVLLDPLQVDLASKTFSVNLVNFLGA
jgi:hypothetical protein